MRGRRRLYLIVAAVSIPILLLVSPGLWDVSISTTRHDLEVVGASIYEFHDQFGRWPASANDLGRTFLSAKMPYWRTILSAGTVVIEWPKSIDPLPHNNASIVLAYYNRGLISAFGHKWVCWGDLRTEYVADVRLQGAIATQVH